jgi:PAS domain S-box-containing protein
LTSAQLYTFKNYNHRDGLITEATLSAAQDSRGYLWIGTDGAGIMRFDGEKFEEIGAKKSNLPFHVSDICHQKNGSILFCTLYDGLYRFVNNKFSFLYKPSPNEGDSKRVVMVDSTIVLITERSITLLSMSGVPFRKLMFQNGKNLVVSQLLNTPQGLYLFSNQQNYHIKGKRIRTLRAFLGKNAPKFRSAFGSYSKNKLQLYSSNATQCLELHWWNDGSIFKSNYCSIYSKSNFQGAIKWVCERQNVLYFLTSDDQIYRIKNERLTPIIPNVSAPIRNITSIQIDQNFDLWMTAMNGIFKVSIEPFTRVQTNPLFENKNLVLIHRTPQGSFLCGNRTNELYLITSKAGQNPIYFSLTGYQAIEYQGNTYVSTNRGIYRVFADQLIPAEFPNQREKNIQLIHWDGTCFWYSEKGQGIMRFDPKTKRLTSFSHLNFDFPSHFYTAQNNLNQTLIYFGTNNGIFEFNKRTQQFRLLSTFNHLGTYCGNSTKDRFGTLWFTLDKGIAGITKSGDYVQINQSKKLPSTLFYTLNSDQFGNLLAGTNRGINVIQVNPAGRVLQQRNYGINEGFGGYETNMRASYQDGNQIYIGTIEGLYLINTDIITHYPSPPKPVVFAGRATSSGSWIDNDGKTYFTLKCLLPKLNIVTYSYRLVGYSEQWSAVSAVNEIQLPSLANGKYKLEVRATYDGDHFSAIAHYPLTISEPIWKSKWFIVFLVIILGVINIAYLELTKSYSRSHIIDTKDTVIDVNSTPKIILFGTIAQSTMLFIASYLEPHNFPSVWSNTFFTIGMLICFIWSVITLRNKAQTQRILMAIYITYALLIFEDFFLISITNVHPFPVLSLVMATSVIPFFVGQIRQVVAITLAQLFVSALLLIWLEETNYNEILFIAAVTISGGLAIMVSYLRNNSLEKLIFVSGIINKGNVIAISFNEKGTVSYCSSNINEYFSIESDYLLGKPLSILNPIVLSSEMRQTKLDEEFSDGKVFLVPMYNKLNAIIWFEWSCKFLNDSVRVIMGQDVTEKITVSTNYQSLVENAHDMIYNTDVNGNFVYANERFIQLFGAKNDSIIGQHSLTLVAPEYREKVAQFYAAQFQNKQHNSYLEFPIKSKDGRIYWVGQNVTMVYEPGSRKRVSGFIALARDITEKRAKDLLIEQQNMDITASIASAKHIQFNLLPKQSLFSSFFDESFVLYRPKDIVSGDFYWVRKIESKLVVVLGDCTGHGIPGAFMTIIGINLLNQLIKERKLTEPTTIMDALNTELTALLPTQEPNGYLEGIELVVATFEPGKVQFATKGVNFIHIKNGQVHRYKQETKHKQLPESITSETLLLSDEDQIYLITDGYQNQYGSVKNKAFSPERLEELLLKIHPESMALQKKYFENALRNWSEGYEQTDDITVIGLKGYR